MKTPCSKGNDVVWRERDFGHETDPFPVDQEEKRVFMKQSSAKEAKLMVPDGLLVAVETYKPLQP